MKSVCPAHGRLLLWNLTVAFQYVQETNKETEPDSSLFTGDGLKISIRYWNKSYSPTGYKAKLFHSDNRWVADLLRTAVLSTALITPWATWSDSNCSYFKMKFRARETSWALYPTWTPLWSYKQAWTCNSPSCSAEPVKNCSQKSQYTETGLGLWHMTNNAEDRGKDSNMDIFCLNMIILWIAYH